MMLGTEDINSRLDFAIMNGRKRTMDLRDGRSCEDLTEDTISSVSMLP
jgi:hypothetical protein